MSGDPRSEPRGEEARGPERGRGIPERRVRLISFLVLAGLSTAVLGSVPWDADPGWWDASRHAMDGAFYLDLIVSGGFLRPLEYAQEYYGRYPAIAPAMYPPFFGVFEAFLFGIFGVHVWVARVSVALFLLWGAYGSLRLTEEIAGGAAGACAGLFYVSLPLVITWSREVMLEPPAAALVIWSFFYFRRFVWEGRTRDLVPCALFAILAPYTKQTTIFLFPALLATALVAGYGRRLLEPRALLAIALAVLAGLPLAYVTFRWGTLNLEQAFGQLEQVQLSWLDHALYHLVLLPETVGWPVLVLAVVGLALLVHRSRGRRGTGEVRLSLVLLCCWALVCYLEMAVLMKEARHGFFWTPVFAVAAGIGLVGLATRIPGSAWKYAAASGLVVVLFAVNLSRAGMNWCEGLRAVAVHLNDHWEGAAVLIDTERDGAFVFRMRAEDVEDRFRIYRSAKIFESRMIHKAWGVAAQIETPGQLHDGLHRYGIRYVLLEEEVRRPTPVEGLLREAVHSDAFRVEAVFPVTYPGRRPAKIILYRYLGELASPPELPTIYLPIVGMEIKQSD